MFRPLIPTTVRWMPLAEDGQPQEGLQHFELEQDGNTIIISGVVIGELEGRRFGVNVSMLLDECWRVLTVSVTGGPRDLYLRSNGKGRWRTPDGPLPQFNGIFDIDLQASPITNTLPIRRLGLTKGMGPQPLSVVYIPFDTFEPFVHEQRYTCLEDGRLYRYENADGSFAADLHVDQNGLVLDYPTLFTRLIE